MSSRPACRAISRTLVRPKSSSTPRARGQPCATRRCLHQASRIPAITSSSSQSRPRLPPLNQPVSFIKSTFDGRRTIFIQTETTPNPDVRITNPTHLLLLLIIFGRPSSSSPTKPSYQKASRLPSSNTFLRARRSQLLTRRLSQPNS